MACAFVGLRDTVSDMEVNEAIQPEAIDLGMKFKAAEKEVARTLAPNSRAVVRFDGKNFSTFTRRFARPFDRDFMAAMDSTAKAITSQIPGAHFAYVQSDEISVVFSDLKRGNSSMWFGGRVDKMLSLGAAAVSGAFARAILPHLGDNEAFPLFDARVIALTDVDEVDQYVRWRRADARKNSITMAASTLRTHKQLMNTGLSERREVLVGTPLEVLPEGFYNGRLVVPTRRMLSTHHIPLPTRQKYNIPDFAERTVLELSPATEENLVQTLA